MRGKRSKQYKKLMQQYGLVFGFREPYQVIVDAQMIQDAEKYTMDLVLALERVLHGKVKPMITQCSIRHLYTMSSLPQSQKDALILRAKGFERRRCNHHTLDQPLSTLECLSSVIDSKNSKTNRNRYVVASQDEEVRRFCRGIRGVPLVYVKRSVMVMEPMAESSLGAREGFEKAKFRVGIRGRNATPGVERKRQGQASDGEEGEQTQHDTSAAREELLEADSKKRKRKAWGVKEPNPLSMKKPRKAKEDSSAVSQEKILGSLRALDEDASPLDPMQGNSNIIGNPQVQDQDLPAKRKRKRKHKTSKIEELKTVLEEARDTGEMS